MRHWRRREILGYFESAFEHNPELATRITFWARAARHGSGERKTFYTILDEIARRKRKGKVRLDLRLNISRLI